MVATASATALLGCGSDDGPISCGSFAFDASAWAADGRERQARGLAYVVGDGGPASIDTTYLDIRFDARRRVVAATIDEG
ncbi:MAG: hypothetical protein HZB46_06155 [Solirubrobacterales bacterium]|nr:hypothetical protein [Solirubrobacterales bacterium]